MSELSIRDRFPAGTQFLNPDYMDDAILGYEFLPTGGQRIVYSAEACIDLLKRNLGLDTEGASNVLAQVCLELGDSKLGFVWGLD